MPDSIWLDKLGPLVAYLGSILAKQSDTLNFKTGLTATYNTTTGQVDIEATSAPGVTNIYDTYANRPAAGVSGRMFICSDGGGAFFDDGISWRPLLPGNVVGVQPLAAASFTPYNGGGTTALADSNGALELLGTDDGGTVTTRGYDIASTNKYVEADATLFMNNCTASPSGIDAGMAVGVILRDISGANWFSFAQSRTFGLLGTTPGAYLEFTQWSNATTRVTSKGVQFYPDSNAPLLLRLRYSGSNVLADISRDSKIWTNVFSLSSPGFAPTRAGLHTVGYDVNGAFPQALIRHFKTSP